MECLHCGDCCERMSPVSAPEPCPFLARDGDFVFCDIYDNRHVDCVAHRHPYKFCPIGVDKLGLKDSQEIARRIDEGWNKIKRAQP